MESDDGDSNSVATASSSKGDRAVSAVPRVVKFGYREFTAAADKWMATCRKCNKRVQDKISVTSAFTK